MEGVFLSMLRDLRLSSGCGIAGLANEYRPPSVIFTSNTAKFTKNNVQEPRYKSHPSRKITTFWQGTLCAGFLS
jgi:hypothetical protein